MAEEDTMVQDMMGMMMVIMMVAVLSQLIPGQVQAAPAANRNVTVTLKDPPEADRWQLTLFDYAITGSIYIKELGIDEAAIFTSLPSNWGLPLKVDLSLYKWVVPGERLQQVYRVQSWRPIKPFTTDEPDPDYKNVYLSAFGSYYYDFNVELFKPG